MCRCLPESSGGRNYTLTKKEKLLNYNSEDLFKVSLEVHDVLPYANKIMHQMLQPGGYDIEFITIRVCNSHMVSTPAIWMG